MSGTLSVVSTLRTARERARSEVTAEILATARRHLAEHGAAGLSLRAVARDLGLVSSAVYRYFENRDALLTALIVDAYDSLGEAAEASLARSARRPSRQRWVAAAEAIRGWALARPHEYALLYGSPVPGYVAPADTVGPGTRVSLALVQVVRDAHRRGQLDPARAVSAGGSAMAAARDLHRLAGLIELDVPAASLLAFLLAWTQLFGLVSFELFGQTHGLIEDHAAFFRAAATAMAAGIGL